MGILPPPLPAHSGPRPWIAGKGLKWIMIGGSLVLIWLVWLFGGIMYHSYKLTSKAIESFHNELNNGQYEQIYQEGSDKFRAASSEAQTVKFLEKVHVRMGNEKKIHVQGFHFNKLNGVTWAVMTCQTEFEHGEGQENFTWRIQNDQPKLFGYRIHSSQMQ